jgi:hypothetical protein
MMNKRLFIHKRGFNWPSRRGRKGEKKSLQWTGQENNLPRGNQLFHMMMPPYIPVPGHLEPSPKEGGAAGQQVNSIFVNLLCFMYIQNILLTFV